MGVRFVAASGGSQNSGTKPILSSANAVASASLSCRRLSRRAARVLTNEDVLALKNAARGDDVVVAKVRSSKGSYKLDTDDLVQLNRPESPMP